MLDAQTLFTVVQQVASGSPARRAAWRAGACPTPAPSTLPIQHCSTASLGTLALPSAPAMASAPATEEAAVATVAAGAWGWVLWAWGIHALVPAHCV